MNDAVRALVGRRSIRTFSQRQILTADMQIIAQILTDVPTHRDTQLLHFTVIQNQGLISEMSEKIRLSMCHHGTLEMQTVAANPNYAPLHHAPTLILFSGLLSADFHVQTECGIAIGQLISIAAVLGLSTCITASSLFKYHGEYGTQLRRRLGIPEGYQTVCSVALGYPAETPRVRPSRREKIHFIP
jgi:nitroreductase